MKRVGSLEAVACVLAIGLASGCVDPGTPADAGRDAGGVSDAGPSRETLADAADVLPDALPDPGSDGGTDADDAMPVAPACAESPGPPAWAGIDPAYVPVSGGEPFLDKNACLLVLLEEIPVFREVLGKGELAALAAGRAAHFVEATEDCLDPACVLDAVTWTAEEVASAGELLADALVPGDGEAAIVPDHLRASGRFHLHRGLADDELLKAAWTGTTTALCDAVRRFAGEAPPDAVDRAIADVKAVVEDADPAALLPHTVLARMAVGLAKAAGRDEAARYEPLGAGENAAALARMADIEWDDWPYTLILVPGWGPNDLDAPLSELGAEHCDLAVLRWQAGWAPFLALSGGHVHPDRTPYAEALEMKRYLMDVHGVPGDAILVDPHARHTTTNLRNVGRQVFFYGIPADRPAVTTTDFLQSAYITALEGRCRDELGYLPWRSIAALTLEDNCLFFAPEVLHAAPGDPLDP